MVLKLKTNATETTTNIVGEVISLDNLLKYKVNALSKGLLIPDSIISKIDDFIKRNSLRDKNTKENQMSQICPKCLKAHAVKKAREIGLNLKTINYLSRIFKAHAVKKAKNLGFDSDSIADLEQIFDCEPGHNGYYLDKDELIKI